MAKILDILIQSATSFEVIDNYIKIRKRIIYESQKESNYNNKDTSEKSNTEDYLGPKIASKYND